MQSEASKDPLFGLKVPKGHNLHDFAPEKAANVPVHACMYVVFALRECGHALVYRVCVREK